MVSVIRSRFERIEKMVLIVNNLISGYRQVPVIKGIDFNISQGEIVGLVGLNGAGKSTLLKTILGLLTPMSGEISLNGETITKDHQAYAQQIAYIPETPILYEELTLQEHLEMTALGYDIPLEIVMERAQPMLKQFRLDHHLTWFPSHFSKGMKQKVMIICALVTDANLLIIDEPFLGLDPLAIDFFSKLLKERASKGCSILFTTHILSIAQELCDQFILLQKGQIKAMGSLTDLRQDFASDQASLNDLYLKMASQEIGEPHE